MTLTELRAKIDALIEATPYSRAQIAQLWEQEDDENWLPENVLALAAAYEYLTRVGKPEAEYLRGKYLRLLDDLREKYSVNH